MAGRPPLPVGTFGTITTIEVGRRRFRAVARFRDWDGVTRKVTTTAAIRSAVKTALKVELVERMRVGGTADSLNVDSPFASLADAWFDDLLLDEDRADSTKEIYEQELRGLVLPAFQHFRVREVSVGCIERFLKEQ